MISSSRVTEAFHQIGPHWHTVFITPRTTNERCNFIYFGISWNEKLRSGNHKSSFARTVCNIAIQFLYLMSIIADLTSRTELNSFQQSEPCLMFPSLCKLIPSVVTKGKGVKTVMYGFIIHTIQMPRDIYINQTTPTHYLFRYLHINWKTTIVHSRRGRISLLDSYILMYFFIVILKIYCTKCNSVIGDG